MNLHVRRSQTSPAGNEAPIFTIHYELEVTPEEVDVLAAYVPGWMLLRGDLFSNLTAGLLPQGVTVQFRNVREASSAIEEIAKAYQDFVNYLGHVNEFDGEVTLRFNFPRLVA